MMSYPCERGLPALLHRDAVLLAGNKTISDSFEVVSRSIVKILQREGQTAAQLKKRNHRKILNKHQVMRILGVVCSVWSSTILKGIICFGKHSMNIISQLGTETNSLRFWCQIMHPFFSTKHPHPLAKRHPICQIYASHNTTSNNCKAHHLTSLENQLHQINSSIAPYNVPRLVQAPENHLLKKMGMTGVVSCYMLFLVVYR